MSSYTVNEAVINEQVGLGIWLKYACTCRQLMFLALRVARARGGDNHMAQNHMTCKALYNCNCDSGLYK